MTQAEVDAKEKIFPGAGVVTVGIADLRILLRAVQAPRLTGEVGRG